MPINDYQELKAQMANWEMNYLPLRDGARLRYGRWRTAGAPAKGHILLIPGRTEFIEKYTEEAMGWAARDYSVLCFDLRGQGGSTREIPHRSHIGSFDTYVEDLTEFWEKICRPAAGPGLNLIEGHSTGAHIALRFAGEHQPAGLNGIIVSAPLVDVVLPANIPPRIAHGIIRLMGRIRPTAYATEKGDYHPLAFTGNLLTNDERRFHEWQQLQQDNPQLTTGGVTWGWAAAAHRSRAQLEAALPRIQVPILALLTPHDRVVDGPAQYRVLKDAIRVEFPDEGHELLRAPDATLTRIWNAKDDFLSSVRQQLPDWRKKQLQGPGL